MLRGRIDHLLKSDSPAEVLRAQELFIRTEERFTEIMVVPFDSAAAAILDSLGRVRG
jgi:hypothetical protein